MLSVFKKIGGYDKSYKVLRESGWNGAKSSLFIQSYRGATSAKVALILWDHCQKNNIPVNISDFQKKEGE